MPNNSLIERNQPSNNEKVKQQPVVDDPSIVTTEPLTSSSSSSELDCSEAQVDHPHTMTTSWTTTTITTTKPFLSYNPFCCDESTETHFKIPDDDPKKFYGSYGHVRKQLDYTFHAHYRKGKFFEGASRS